MFGLVHALKNTPKYQPTDLGEEGLFVPEVRGTLKNIMFVVHLF